ncbi:MAG: PorT family protein [Fibrobacter sp.]|nr:PorT family protein [Fibrobacter sp.]
MKKLFFLVAVMLFAASSAFAQFSLGGHAAVNYSTMWGDETDDVPWGLGFNAGVATKISLGLFAVAPEVDVGLRRQSDDDVTWSTWAIEIPILARINVLPILFIEAGPQLAFLLSSEVEQDFGMGKVTVDYGDDKIDALNTFEFGLAAGVGATVIPNLDVNFRAVFGLTSVIDSKKVFPEADEQSIKNMQFQLGATYWFM